VGEQGKVLITGDDILIEYTERLMSALKQVSEPQLRVAWKNSIEKFLQHYVWHNQDSRGPLW